MSDLGRKSLNALYVILLGIGLTACAELASFGRAEAVAEPVDDTTLIVLTDTDPEGLVTRAEGLGYVLERRSDLPELGDILLTFKIPDGTTIPQAIDEVEALQAGSTAGANHAYRLQMEEPAQLTVSAADQMIGWPQPTCAARGRVGIIDAGVVASHQGFAGGQIVQQDFTQTGAAPRTDHGTLMADIMLSDQRLGGVQLYSAKVVEPDVGDGQIAGAAAIVRAVDWMMQNDVPVVNISLAGPQNKILRRGLTAAAEKGLIIVAAAGNLGPNAAELFPAAFPFAIAVTAIDQDRDIYRRAVQGSQIDFAAPGVDVIVQSQDRLRIVSGTSAAATFVTSAIAADPVLRGAGDAAAARAQLSDRALDLGANGRDPIFGEGLVMAGSNCG